MTAFITAIPEAWSRTDFELNYHLTEETAFQSICSFPMKISAWGAVFGLNYVDALANKAGCWIDPKWKSTSNEERVSKETKRMMKIAVCLSCLAVSVLAASAVAHALWTVHPFLLAGYAVCLIAAGLKDAIQPADWDVRVEKLENALDVASENMAKFYAKATGRE